MSATDWSEVMTKHPFAAGFIAMLVFTGTASAQARNGQARGQAATNQSRPSNTQFSTQDRQTTSDWYNQNQAHPSAGFRQQDRLPPDLESRRRLASRLDPQLQKKVQPFPSDLRRRLPVPASGYRYAAGGGHVTLRDKKNQLQDIIHVHS